MVIVFISLISKNGTQQMQPQLDLLIPGHSHTGIISDGVKNETTTKDFISISHCELPIYS